ncbi:hypothetical protein FOZ60_015846 [Perkinsus olseni]|uniref:Uncharacterized protein n=1 Tax=Perkinsus olseni TaxID=32597 RepID=A0A7J6P5D1_PEROL|nr:hypothetical protein FOZ60_015846 [Perkinsus olseni]
MSNSRKAAVPHLRQRTASSTRGVGSSGSVSLATPSPSEESSEEGLRGGEDMNSRVDAGEIDEFGMVITDESGEGREDGHAKDGGGETERRPECLRESSPLRLKGLMIMWIGVLYRTIMTCAYGMVTRRRAAAEAKESAREEEERQEAMLKESPDDGSPEGGDGSASSSPSPEGGRGLTPSKSPSVEDAPSPTEMDKQPAHHHHHSSNSHFQMLTAEDATGVYTHVKWIYDVELPECDFWREVKADPQLKAMVMGKGRAMSWTRIGPADTAKFDELFMWTGMPDVISHVAETSITAYVETGGWASVLGVNLGEGASEGWCCREIALLRPCQNLDLSICRPQGGNVESADLGDPEAMPRKTTQTTGCRLWWTPRDDKGTAQDTPGQERPPYSDESTMGKYGFLSVPTSSSVLAVFDRCGKSGRNQQREPSSGPADTDVAKDMVKAFVDTVPEHWCASSSARSRVLREDWPSDDVHAKFSINNGKEGGNQQQRGANDAKGREERRSYSKGVGLGYERELGRPSYDGWNRAV